MRRNNQEGNAEEYEDIKERKEEYQSKFPKVTNPSFDAIISAYNDHMRQAAYIFIVNIVFFCTAILLLFMITDKEYYGHDHFHLIIEIAALKFHVKILVYEYY